MRQRGQIARRADAALARDERHRVGVEQALQRFDDQWPDARKAAPEAEQFQQYHEPRDVARQRFAEAGAVAEDEVGLELRQPIVGDAGVGEQAEAGVDPVHRLAARNDAIDRRGGGCDALHGGSVEHGRFARPKLAKRCSVDRFGVELEHDRNS